MSQRTEIPELKRIATFNGKGWKEYKIFVYKNESTVLVTFVKFVEVIRLKAEPRHIDIQLGFERPTL